MLFNGPIFKLCNYIVYIMKWYSYQCFPKMLLGLSFFLLILPFFFECFTFFECICIISTDIRPVWYRLFWEGNRKICIQKEVILLERALFNKCGFSAVLEIAHQTQSPSLKTMKCCSILQQKRKLCNLKILTGWQYGIQSAHNLILYSSPLIQMVYVPRPPVDA